MKEIGLDVPQVTELCYELKNNGIDIDNNKVYMQCFKCGGAPEKVYVDLDGVQVSYESKLLNDIKQVMNLVEQRIYNLEVNIKDLERSQNILEQSLAYINKYLVEKN